MKTLPGVREAIEERDWGEAQRQIVTLVDTIRQVATEVDRATRLVEPAGP